MLKRFLSYYKPYKLMFTFDMLASLLVSVIGIFYPIITRVMLNDYVPNRQYNLIILFGSVLLGLYFVKNCTYILYNSFRGSSSIGTSI